LFLRSKDPPLSVLLSREGWLYREIFRLFVFMLSLKTGLSSIPIYTALF
jgi:hypothetical protein